MQTLFEGMREIEKRGGDWRDIKKRIIKYLKEQELNFQKTNVYQ